MADKNRIRPRKLYFNEAALRRVPPNHPKIHFIAEDSRRREAGYAGEKRVDTILENLPKKNYHILQGLRLANEAESHFQIDNVLLSPTHLLTIEVKNLAGELTFDRKAGQLIQKIDNKKMVMKIRSCKLSSKFTS
ncbi:nuclease-related domain-containing protein [Bacillus sp. 1NLA3E]|uniref:nuclease-related domain-containing protein n=1 Tax=Bacillus sp. 1NLA3E TaxID=666686 RepID=UPI0002E6A462|nr:nuclease-related domain-containing protein [Bacillus sp. 1NLA3E]